MCRTRQIALPRPQQRCSPEEKLEPIFHPDSYGYRPGRSCHDALAVTRKRCWKQDWVLDLDVRVFFRQRSP